MPDDTLRTGIFGRWVSRVFTRRGPGCAARGLSRAIRLASHRVAWCAVGGTALGTALGSGFGAGSAAFALAGAAAVASGQSWIEQANALYDDIIPSRRSENIILPALIGLEPAPVGVETIDKAMMMFAGAQGWSQAESWATSAPSRAVLEALDKATVGETYDTAKAFSLRYGTDGVSVEMIRAGMYTELGDPPLLAGAKHRYMDKFDDLRCLVHVEATRLLSEGEVAQAMDLLVDLAQFGYQIADRETLKESRWGYVTMANAIMRVRDIAYQDFKGDRKVDLDAMGKVIDRLHPENGALRLDRLNFPRGNEIAARQLIDVLYIPRAGVDETRFVSTMVRLATSDLPLRRFSAASRFEANMDKQKSWFEIDDVVDDVFASWSKKWSFDRFDPVLALPFAWETDVVGEDALVVRVGVGGDMGELFDLRTQVTLERVGTRQALGLLGRYYLAGSFAPKIDGIRPRWVDRLEDDPLNTLRTGGRLPPMRYFRPVTDFYLPDERAERQPHTMQLFPGDGTNFEVTLYEDQFLLYSTGENGVDDNGIRLSVDPESMVGDYLIWPPMLGLHREHLRQIGEIN